MGISKEFRKGLKYRVASARCKTLESLLSVKFNRDLGMSETEARLLGDRIGKWIYLRPDIRGPNQIIFEASNGRESFARRYNTVKQIKLSAYDIEDLDLELEFGLYTGQNGRLLRMVEEAYSQDSLLSAKQLTLLLTISPTALRKKLKSLRDEAIFVPIKGMGKDDRKRQNLFRSTWALSKYFQEEPLTDIRKKTALTKDSFRNIYSSFVEIAKGLSPAMDEQESQWLDLAKTIPSAKLGQLKAQTSPLRGSPDWDEFGQMLTKDFNLSPIKLVAIKEEVDEIICSLGKKRSPGDIIYWAVSAGEPAGKPLDQAILLPATLTLYDPSDMPDRQTNRDINRVSDIKLQKAIRLATQAKAAGAYLSYADLGYLLGIHCQAISRLIKASPSLVVPLRGASCDIGQGITHRKKIIGLYLEMYTETEIVSRTGHSYESIENYINEFANVYVLHSRGMPLALMRRVTGRSTRLISAYLELIEQYQGPEYAFRFSHLRQIFKMHDLKKKRTIDKRSMDKHELYRPLIERSLENYQMQHLARKYDFGKESLVSKLMIERINKAMDEAEKNMGISRVKPFCLYIRSREKKAILPLFEPQYLQPIFEGKNLNITRERAIEKISKIYAESFPKEDISNFLSIIAPLPRFSKNTSKEFKKNLAKKGSGYNSIDNKKLASLVESANTTSPLKRLNILDWHAPQKVMQELSDFVEKEVGFGRVLARQLVEDIITIRASVCPRTCQLKSGEMPMLVTHVSAKLTEDTDTRYRKLAPVIITVLSKEEMDGFCKSMDEYIETFSKRILRVCFEAYKQNGLLTLQEMQWIFMANSTKISEIIRTAEYKHNIIIPTPGTILDAGRSITHKDIIVKLHLEGHNVKDISRITYHSPRSVDSYIGTFEAVLILYLYKMPVRLMSRVLGKGITLIKEHLRLIEEVYEDVTAIKKDLIKKGVSF